MSKKPIPNSRISGLFSAGKETITKPNGSNQEEVMSHESLPMKHEPTEVMSHESLPMKHEPTEVMSHESLPMKHDIDPHVLNSAVIQGCKDPRISAYSPLAMSVLRYLRKTTPEFSMSKVASSLLEDAIREKYPEISNQVEKTLAEKP
jgi:hypothetical protein